MSQNEPATVHPRYRFNPYPDIIAYELWVCMQQIGTDISSETWGLLPRSLQRHFQQIRVEATSDVRS